MNERFNLKRAMLCIALGISFSVMADDGELDLPDYSVTAEEPDIRPAEPAGASDISPTIPVNGDNDDEAVSAPPQRESHRMEEILVTAQRREESLQDIPIAISVFSGDRLGELGITDTRDLQKLVPGFNASESGRNSTMFTMRGVGFADTTYTATSTVGIYVDEINIPYGVMARGANLDIERVEVLKGPQGTLYGRNTTGGLINYTAAKPTENFEAGTLTSYSRFDTIESENFVSGPLTETLLGRLAFKIIRSDGWQRSVTRPGDTLGKTRKISARGTLDWRPGDNWLITFRLEGWRDRSDPTAPQAIGIIPGNPFIGMLGLNPEVLSFPYFPVDGGDPRDADWPTEERRPARLGQYPGKHDDQFYAGSIKAIWNLTDTMELTTILSHMKHETDGTPALQGLHISETDLSTFATIRTNSVEMRVSDNWFNDRFHWSLGGLYSEDDAFEDQVPDTRNTGALFSIANIIPGIEGPITDHVSLNGEPQIKQWGVFLNTDTDLTEQLGLNLALRYSVNNQDYTACATEPEEAEGLVGLSNVFTALSLLAATQYTLNTGMPGDPRIVRKGDCFSLGEDGNNDPFEDSLDESNLSGRVAFSWSTYGGSLYYVSATRGFKAGGFPVLNPARKSQLVPVVEEELRAYELGTKLSLLDGQLFTGIGGFYYDYINKQLLTKTLDEIFGPLAILANAPKSRVWGVELETRYTPVNGLFIAFAGSYIDTKIREFVGTNSEGNTQDFTGLPFNFAPEWQLNALADYSWPITSRLDMGIAADAYYSGETNGAIDQNPLLHMEDYILFGARIRLGPNDGRWTATLFGRNLTNELANVGSNSWSEIVTRNVMPPRSVGISLQYTWQ